MTKMWWFLQPGDVAPGPDQLQAARADLASLCPGVRRYQRARGAAQHRVS